MPTSLERVTERVKQSYPNEEVGQAVLADAVRLGTIDQIDSGEKVLPHPADAQRWHDRITGKANLTPKESEQASQIDALQKRVEAMERELSIPQAPRPSTPE